MPGNERKGISLFYRFLVAFLAVFIVVTGLLTVIFYIHSKKSIEKHTKENISQRFGIVSDEFDHEFTYELVRDLKKLASNPVLDEFMISTQLEREINARLAERLFLQLIHFMKDYQNISFVDYLGREKIRVDRTGRIREYRDLSSSKLFTQLESGAPGEIHIEGPYRGKDGESLFSIGINVIDEDIGQFGGVIIIEYSLESFLNSFDDIKILGEKPMWVFSPDGEVLRQPLNERAFFDPRAYLSEGLQDVPLLSVYDEGMLVYQDLSVIPGETLIRLAMSVPSSLLLKDITSTLRFFSVVFLISILIILLVSYYLSRYLSRPINQLSKAVARFAKGELSTRVKVKTAGEVQMLVNSFNQMAEDLEKTTVSRNYVDNIIKSMFDMLVVVLPDGKIERTNTAVGMLLGYGEELIGKPVEVIFDKGLPNEGSWFNDVCIKGFVGNIERTCLSKDGRKIPVLFSASAMRVGNSPVQGIVCVAKDITNQKLAEGKLKQYAEKLEQSNKELEDFAHIASHDLNEPLRKVQAFGDRLKATCSEALDDQGMDYLKRMQSAAGRMQSLINDLLMLSRVATRVQPFASVSLSTVVHGVLSDLEIRIEQAGGRVEVGDLPAVEADPSQMRQLFQNLISNALKFRKEGESPVVKISSQCIRSQSGLSENKFCQITVEDNGIGLDKEHAKQIFGVFQRLHGRSEYEGSGMGLAICRKIVELHGGSITATGIPGQGATFVFTLPV